MSAVLRSTRLSYFELCLLGGGPSLVLGNRFLGSRVRTGVWGVLLLLLLLLPPELMDSTAVG